VGTVHRELLDRTPIVGRRQLETVLSDYVLHNNQHRPHRCHDQGSPLGVNPTTCSSGRRTGREAGSRRRELIHEYAQTA
jgi:hypothetical protein